MKNKSLGLFASLILILSFMSPVSAAPKVLINGRSLESDVSPEIQNSRVMVPMSAIFKALGAEVTWTAETQTIQGSRNLARISLQVGKTVATVDGKQIILDCPPVIVDGRTMVPLGFIAKSLGAQVFWDGSIETVSIVLSDDVLPTKEQIMRGVSPAVVELSTINNAGIPYKYGSGVIISANGQIVTNYHVVEDASKIKIKLKDDREFECASPVKFDKDMDIAILKIDAATPYVELGNSDSLSEGDAILTIGCPRHLERTISDGLVSAMRTFDKQKYIQISAPIDHGSSGGALLDQNGKLVGITCAGIDYAQNLNFAIPINDVKVLLKNGK